MEYSIRKVDIKDSESIAELSNQLGYESDSRVIEHRLSELLKNPDHCVFVASVNGKIIGWIHGFYSLRVESNSFVEIGGLIIDSNYRKQGIGKLLIEEINNWSNLRKCKKVRVRCNTARKKTHFFYLKNGYELSKEQKVFDKKLN